MRQNKNDEGSNRMSVGDWLILRAQLFSMRKTHPEMAGDIKRYMAMGRPPAEAIRLATVDQARRLKERDTPAADLVESAGDGNTSSPQLTVETLYGAAVEVFNKAVVRDDVVQRTTNEITAKPAAVAKRGGDPYLVARAVLLGIGKILDQPGRLYDDAICILAAGIVSAAAMLDATTDIDADGLRTKTIKALNAAFRDDEVKSVMLVQMPNAMALARQYNCIKVAVSNLQLSAEQLAEGRPQLDEAIGLLAQLFIMTSTAVTTGFAQRS